MSTSAHRVGKYELVERLGRGGMGEVWKALDTQLGRYVAFKTLRPGLQHDPSFLTRFQREAQLMASLHHPHIVQIYDFHLSRSSQTSETLAYIVMDYVEGPTLAHYLRQSSHESLFPSPDDLLRLFTPICLAIDYAHQGGVIHRDLKPANILLDSRTASKHPLDHPMLADFGLAKLVGAPSSFLGAGWVGTPS